MGHSLGKVASFAVPIAAAIFAPELLPALGAFAAPLGAGLASAGLDYATNGHNFGKALEGGALSGAGSYAGSQIGGSLLGGASGTGAGAAGATAAAPAGAGAVSGSGAVGGLSGDALNSAGSQALSPLSTAGGDWTGSAAAGSTLGSGAGQTAGSAAANPSSILGSLSKGMGNINLGTIGSNAGSTIGNALPSGIASTGVGSALGGAVGSQVAGGMIDQSAPIRQPGAWTPSQSAASSLPPSLSSLSSLNPTQQASNIATQGTYGGGVGPQEESYYTNLLNRQLVDSGGHVGSLSSLSPIENTYNQQLGLGGFTNPTDLLKALSSWSPS